MRGTIWKGALTAGLFALAAGLLGTHAATAESPPEVEAPARVTSRDGLTTAGGQRINDPSATTPGYQRNALGLTYGSAADAPRPDLEPDLVWVITLQGGSGYVYDKELSPPPPPVSAVITGATDVRVLTAYASDGVTPVGTFGVGGGSVAAVVAN